MAQFEDALDNLTRSTYNRLHETLETELILVDQNDGLVEDVIHLARFGLQGRSTDVMALARKMAAKYRSDLPELAEGLADLSSRSGAVRLARRPMPVDADSRMALARSYDASDAVRPILQQSANSQIESVIAEHLHIKALTDAGLSPTRTLLLVGPPGVGKTMTAHWIAAQIKRPLLVLDLASSISSYLGKTGQNLRQLLDFGKEFDSVLLLDEVDAIAKRRSDESDLGELKRLVNVLLQELDEWPEGHLLVAATNHPSLLDPAVWRRFDEVVELCMPTDDARQVLVMEQMPELNADISGLTALLMDGLSHAEIVALVNRAKKSAVLRESLPEDCLLEALEHRIRTTTKEERMLFATAMYHRGMSQRRISDLTGLARNTLRKRVQETNQK